MPINKSFPVETGASPTHHEIAKIEITPAGVRALVNSYLAAPISGTSPRINWQDTYAIDPAALAGPDLIGSAEAWLISPAGPFAGGTLVGVATPAAQLRAQLIALAATRRRELRKVYVHDGIPFDADEASASNILAKLTAPVLLAAAGYPAPSPADAFSYKCADDVYRTYTTDQFSLIGFGMLAYVQDLYTRERELIDLINAAAEDAEALAALVPIVKTFTRPPVQQPAE